MPDGARDPLTGAPLHDDLVISAALCALLDGEDWPVGSPGVVVARRDALEEMDAEGF